jgi:homogentisate 1,2-dioxygenase
VHELTPIRSEAVEGALPLGQNSPQKPAYGLYAEKLSGTAFTAPRHENQQTWLYRILPAAAHENFEALDADSYHTEMISGKKKLQYIPNQLRWNPFDLDESVDWVHGLHLVAGAGDPTMKSGLGILLYAAGRDMGNEAFYSADGDFLIVPQHGVLDIQTELGRLRVRPNEICVVPRGIRYVSSARGYRGIVAANVALVIASIFDKISSVPSFWTC